MQVLVWYILKIRAAFGMTEVAFIVVVAILKAKLLNKEITQMDYASTLLGCALPEELIQSGITTALWIGRLLAIARTIIWR